VHAHAVMALLLAGCGRIGFGTTDAGMDTTAPIGHDEDGDGIADVDDLCPHLPGPHDDGDGDHVGDDCDPEPLNPRQTLTLFTLVPGDQPMTLGGPGTWTQGADSIHYDGIAVGSGFVTGPVTDVRIALGIDIVAKLGGSVQHQLALGVNDSSATTGYFVELNEISGTSRASAGSFDGISYRSLDSTPLPGGVHVGSVFLQDTMVGPPTPSVTMDGGWPGEMYTESGAAPAYAGGDDFSFATNNLEVEVRYLVVIATAP
jgi:hypothetical protein